MIRGRQPAMEDRHFAALRWCSLHTACFLLLLLLAGCRVNYGFTGGDVGEARTVSVDVIEARAPLATPLSAQVLTETLRDLLLAQTPLKLKREEGDVQYSGALVGYDVQPVNIQANETAALNRLTMTVSITYINKLEPKKNAEFTVSRFSDYDSTQDLVSVEERLAREIGKQLAQDIFDRTLGSW
ncbi:MAG TPA: LptE family protein [Flavobacteriales bacterium]|nr:LptE family protein [Flavobacteriales bacterium]